MARNARSNNSVLATGTAHEGRKEHQLQYGEYCNQVNVVHKNLRQVGRLMCALTPELSRAATRRRLGRIVSRCRQHDGSGLPAEEESVVNERKCNGRAEVEQPPL